jgi:thymidylate kinase
VNSTNSPGYFVALVGPDGAGKTTVASEMIRQHGVPSLYVHFRPKIASRPDQRPTDGPPPARKRRTAGPKPLGWLRLGWSLTVFWVGYLRWIRPARRRGALIVGDRWVYGYVTQPVALGYGGPSWLARAACQSAPRADLVVRLTAPSEVVAARKSDLTPDEIRAEDELWETLTQVDLTLDARLDPTEIAANILRQLDRPLT